VSDPLDAWPTFIDSIRTRLEAGRAEYGDRSFDAPPDELRREISEELQDVCAWSYILWKRLQSASCNGGCEESRTLRARNVELREELLSFIGLTPLRERLESYAADDNDRGNGC
jgi:hypothetical protein